MNRETRVRPPPKRGGPAAGRDGPGRAGSPRPDFDLAQEVAALRTMFTASEARARDLESEVATLRRKCEAQAAELGELRKLPGGLSELRAFCEVGFDLRDAQVDLLSTAVDQVRREQGQHYTTLEKCLECCARACDENDKESAALRSIWAANASTTTTDSDDVRLEVVENTSPTRDRSWSHPSSSAKSSPKSSTVAVVNPPPADVRIETLPPPEWRVQQLGRRR